MFEILGKVLEVVVLSHSGPTAPWMNMVGAAVRRQSSWDQERPNLRESLAHLVGLIMRRAGGDASGAFRASFV